MSSRTAKTIGIAVVTLLALVLRLHRLDYESLFMDELRQVSYYRNSLVDIIGNAASTQQPPLDYWIGHIFFHFSDSDFSARLPAALFGTAAVWLIMHLAARDTGWALALFVGLVLGLSPYHIYFSQDARPYAIAIFFFLAFLWALDNVYRRERPRRGDAVLLFWICLLFFLTRMDSPVVVAFLVVAYAGACAVHERFIRPVRDQKLAKHLTVIVSIGLAFACYLPFLLVVLESSTRYAPEGGRLDLNMLVQGLGNFSPVVIWRAFVVQTEPLAWLLLMTTVGGMVAAATMNRKAAGVLLPLTAYLLPLATALHVFILQAKTGAPFRPPYAIYLLPLGLLLTAYCLSGVKDWLVPRIGPGWALGIGGLILASALVSQVSAVHEFKQKRIKSDWRGLTTYLQDRFDSNHVLVFETLTAVDTWSPDFYGFPRYYRGTSTGLSLVDVLANLDAFSKVSARPVLILFHYRNYFLLDGSPYGIFPIGRPDPRPLSETVLDRQLQVQAFTGFSVVTLNADYGNLALNTYRLLDRLLNALPRDSSTTTMQAVAAALAGACGLEDKPRHIQAARAVARPTQRQMSQWVESSLQNRPGQTCSTKHSDDEKQKREN